MPYTVVQWKWRNYVFLKKVENIHELLIFKFRQLFLLEVFLEFQRNNKEFFSDCKTRMFASLVYLFIVQMTFIMTNIHS